MYLSISYYQIWIEALERLMLARGLVSADELRTGEVSASMLLDVGCRYVLVGHSERRQFHGEDDGLVARKLSAALAALLRNDVPESLPRPQWNRRPPDRSPLPPQPALVPGGLAPGEDDPPPPEFAAAVDALHGLLHRNHRGPHTVARGTQIDGSWYEGRTVRKLGRKAGL